MTRASTILINIRNGEYDTDKIRNMSGREKYENLLKEIFADEFNWESFNFKDDNDIKSRMDLYLSNLKDSYRAAIELRYIHGYTYAKIAREFNIMSGSIIKDNIYKGLRELRSPIFKNIIYSSLTDEKLNNIDVGVLDTLYESGITDMEKLISIIPLLSKDIQKDIIENLTIPTPTITLDKNDLQNLILSSRSYNCIRRAGANNIYELFILCMDGNLLNIRNLGRVHAIEIIDKLTDYIKKLNNV